MSLTDPFDIKVRDAIEDAPAPWQRRTTADHLDAAIRFERSGNHHIAGMFRVLALQGGR